MEIIFLGTSSGTPTKSRNVSAVVIKNANSKNWCLVDCGEGTQHQLLRTSLTLNRLETLFVTHMHGDHCYGLPGLLASATMSGRTKPLTVVGPRIIEKYFRIIKSTTQLRLSYKINFIAVEDCIEMLNTQEFGVEAVELSHRIPSFAYAFSEKKIQRKLNQAKLKTDGIEPGPVWGKIQNGIDVVLSNGQKIKSVDYLLEARKKRKVIISGDNDTPDLLSEHTKSVDVLVHESTYTDAVAKKVGSGPQHSSAKMISQFAQNAGIANLILTHFSPRYQYPKIDSSSINEIEIEAKKYYTGNLFIANDFDVFQLDIDRNLKKTSG